MPGAYPPCAAGEGLGGAAGLGVGVAGGGVTCGFPVDDPVLGDGVDAGFVVAGLGRADATGAGVWLTTTPDVGGAEAANVCDGVDADVDASGGLLLDVDVSDVSGAWSTGLTGPNALTFPVIAEDQIAAAVAVAARPQIPHSAERHPPLLRVDRRASSAFSMAIPPGRGVNRQSRYGAITAIATREMTPINCA